MLRKNRPKNPTTQAGSTLCLHSMGPGAAASGRVRSLETTIAGMRCTPVTGKLPSGSELHVARWIHPRAIWRLPFNSPRRRQSLLPRAAHCVSRLIQFEQPGRWLRLVKSVPICVSPSRTPISQMNLFSVRLIVTFVPQARSQKHGPWSKSSQSRCAYRCFSSETLSFQKLTFIFTYTSSFPAKLARVVSPLARIV